MLLLHQPKHIDMKKSQVIALRKKALKDGAYSLYLDCYQNGKHSYEFLKGMRLQPETGKDAAATRKQNKITLRAAEIIRAQREADIINGQAGLRKQSGLQTRPLTDAFKLYKSKRTMGKTTLYHATMAVKYATEFAGNNLRLCDITPKWVLAFQDYLATTDTRRGKRAACTITAYMTQLRYMLDWMRDNGYIINSNPFAQVKDALIKPEAAKREYLTADEVKRLEATPCGNDEVKKMFLFSCYTGLRISDIRALLWEDIREEEAGSYLYVRMVKTKEPIRLALCNRALQLIGQRQSGLVFRCPAPGSITYYIRGWVKIAGINKHVSFHVARHSFATIGLTAGVDIYTISKLLGHKNVTTTQVYAEMINQRKDEAINKISQLLNSVE